MLRISKIYMCKILKNQIFVLSLCLGLIACAGITQPVSDKNSSLTQGNIQLNLKKGVTTKAEILEQFGAPNITTRDDSGKETWTYQRSAQEAKSSFSFQYWTILLAGQAGNNSGFASSSSMLTLIIKFDEHDIVYEYNSRTSHF